MNEVVMFITFKLKKDANVEEFLEAAKALNDGYMSKQKGYISWKQLVDQDIWADQITWESMEDAKKILEATEANDLALKFYSYLNCNSCVTRLYTVKKSYQL